MQVLSSNTISDALLVSIPRLASILPPDILEALIAARDRETHERAKIVLDQLVLNAQIANEDHVPICQDTGTVWLCLEVGPDIALNANVFSKVDQSVAAGFINSKLRKSVVRDALFDRTNTGDNTPAFCELRLVDEPGVARLHMMLKGGGSDNASRVVMLTPNAGKQGVIDTVLSCVEEKAANACPPLVVGVGVGGTFDKVAGLSKLALMRPLNVAARSRNRRIRAGTARGHQCHRHRCWWSGRRHHRARRACENCTLPYRCVAGSGEHGLLGVEEAHR